MNKTVVEKAHIENRMKRDFAIDILKMLKAEIHDIKLELDCDYYTGDKITRLVDNYIAELKGE